MKSLYLIRRQVVAFIAMGLFLLAVSISTGAHAQRPHAAVAASSTNPNGSGNNSGGVGRQGNGQPLRVMVMMNGAPVAKASVIVSVGDGSVILRGVTKPNGTFTTMLDQGIYNVSASTPKGKATSPVTIVQSTDPATVPLTLAAQ